MRTATLSALSVTILLAASPSPLSADTPSFHYEIVPLLTRAGCNAGVCHGTPRGKNGFRLSLRGFDPEADFHALTRDMDGRRINRLHPERSLMLQKATSQIPHQGGRRIARDSADWELLNRWIAAGANIDQDPPQITQLEISPPSSELQSPQDRQPLTITAHFSDGSAVNVTQRCRFTVTDEDILRVDSDGIVHKKSHGEATVTAEFAGRMASSTLLFRDNVPAYRQRQIAVRNPIDNIVLGRLERLQIEPAALANDETFIRRVYLDLTGRLPEPSDIRAFLSRDERDRRAELIEDLLASQEFADWWAMKWTDRLGCNQRFVGKSGAIKYHAWVRHHMSVNTPHDEFVRTILTAAGANYTNPPAGFWRRMRVGGIGKMDPLLAAEEVSQLFMGVRIQCARCHNHPGEKWTQDDYYSLAAFFPRVQFKQGPFYSQRYDQENTIYLDDSSEVTHPRTEQTAQPKFPDGPVADVTASEDRRSVFATWLTSPQNPFFARNAVNRIWFQLHGRGIVEPVDDFRTSNPPSHPELLDWLESEFIRSGFDRKHVIRLIVNSSIYQLGYEKTATATEDARYFSYRRPQLLQAEQMLDAICQATQVPEAFSGFPRGTRAVLLPDGEFKHPFLNAFGRPARALACECERENSPNMSQAIQITGSSMLQEKLSSDTGRVARLAASDLSDKEVLNELWLATLSRRITAEESQVAVDYLTNGERSRREKLEDILWNLINHREFLLQH